MATRAKKGEEEGRSTSAFQSRKGASKDFSLTKGVKRGGEKRGDMPTQRHAPMRISLSSVLLQL